MKIRNLTLTFPLFIYQAFSATNAVQYSIPGAIEIRVKGGICSGSVVGDSPLKVLTAEHCLANLRDGGVEIIDPVATQASGKVKWIKSSKVYVSNNLEYRKVVEKKYRLSLEIEEANLIASTAAIKLASARSSSSGALGSFFGTPQEKISKEEEAKLEKVVKESLSSILALNSELNSVNKSLSLRFADYDLAVLIFPTSLVGALSVEQRVKNREILPIARSSLKEKDIPVVIGGFGMTSTETQKPAFTLNSGTPEPLRSHFTTNILSKNTKKSSIYSLLAHTPENLKKAKVAAGTMGAPLLGDSGSGVLSEEGILGVTSSAVFYSSHIPPAPNWVNMVDDPEAAIERYNYMIAHFPSTTSPIAQEIFAEVESTSGPLVYADQVAEYSKVFVSERLSILATGSSNPLLELFKFPSVNVVIR